MLRLWQRAQNLENHEELFVQRGAALRGWALQLTDQDGGEAEDLVQDAFIQFTLLRPELNAIGNLDGYLFELLRNLHISHLRRPARSRLQQLSIIDYDSAETGLLRIDPRERIQAQDELRAVCQYTCARKETSKAGSVLILRFFHGYYPSEITRVMRSSRKVADIRLLVARREAKLFLENPDQISLIKTRLVPAPAPVNPARTEDELLLELRRTIFESRQGECFTRQQLHELYRAPGSAPIDCAPLAHLVSCPRCLDEVNQLLDLPPLADRYPLDTLGPEPRPKGPRQKGGGGGSDEPPGGATSVGADQSARRRRHIREAFEHRPQELHIAVNGLIQGSRRINAESNDLTLDLNLAERISFVEVFSEQEIRLLAFNVAEPPPRGPSEQSARVELSDGRSLELTLKFRSLWPMLQAVYYDPLMTADYLKDLELAREGKFESASEDGSPLAFSPAAAQEPRTREALLNRWRPFVSLLWLRPGMVTAVVAAVLIAALFFDRLRAPSVSAAELIRRASAAEEVIARRPDLVLHRTINLEERQVDGGWQSTTSLPAGRLISRRRIEVWHSAEKGITVRRLYDEQGQLMAGEWRKADGSHTTYQRQGNDKIRHPPSAIRHQEVWQLEFSAQGFAAIIQRLEAAKVEEQGTAYVISSQSPASDLVKATLRLSRADLLPVEQTLLVRRDGEAREYRWTESSYERRPVSAVAPAVFEPEAELLGSDTGTRKHGDTAIVSPSPRLPVSPSPAVATVELEVEVLRLLNQAGADLGERVSVTRTPESRLRVEGIVETGQRKEELLRALSPVSSNPAVKIEIKTVAEALSQEPPRAASPGPLTVERIEAASNTLPVEPELRRYFAGELKPNARSLEGKTLDARIDEEVQGLANRVLRRSRQALLHAWALKRLATRFSPQDLRTLEVEARGKWLALIGQHAGGLQQQTKALRQDLEPIFFPVASSDEAPLEISSSDDAALVRAVEQLFEMVVEQEQLIRSAFTISAEAAAGGAIKTPQFRRALKGAEKLATQIQHAGMSDK